MNRRSLIAAAPAVLLAGAVPAAASETPIMRLYRRYVEISEAAGKYSSQDDAELYQLFYDERDRIEDEMLSRPSRCAADVAAKMLTRHGFGELSCLDRDDPVWIEARVLVAA